MTSESNEATILTGATVLAGDPPEPVRSELVVAGGRITSLEPDGGVTRSGARVIDCAGMTLLPGFIDTHVHIGFYPPPGVLRGGVTTVRDLACPPEEIFTLVDRSKEPGFDGPEILAAGQMLTAPGGYPMHAAWAPAGTGREVRSVDDADQAVAEQVDAGACVIKVALNPPVGPVLRKEILLRIVETAHRADLRVTAHVHGLAELHKALDCGIDELAHMLLGSEQIPSATIDAMVAGNMTIVPTLSCRFDDLDLAIKNLARWHGTGGRIVYGTDLGNEGPEPGIDRREVSAMQRAGMSPQQIVASATSGAAAYLGLADRGILEPGRVADVIGVKGDPLDDLAALQNIRLVMRRGRTLN
jgi:imidazolonepropionase-like amidohydrolase